MRTHIALRLALALGAGIPVVGGCAAAPPPTPVARDFGVAHRLAVFGQTAYPGAEENAEPVEGVDGKVALGAVNAYRGGRGYDKAMDASQFDIRPTQPAVSEVTYKDLSGPGKPGAGPNVSIGK